MSDDDVMVEVVIRLRRGGVVELAQGHHPDVPWDQVGQTLALGMLARVESYLTPHVEGIICTKEQP